jgi:hypothetical protein
MSITVCVAANTIGYPEAGGQFWVYLNWALGFQSLGCRVVWLEGLVDDHGDDALRASIANVEARLRPYGLGDAVALFSWSGHMIPRRILGDARDVDDVEADLLLNIAYHVPKDVLGRFKRSAFLDIDPGLSQVWMSTGDMTVAPHDTYFTIGETVGQPEARFPDGGRSWTYTPPCVALDWWPSCEPAAPGVPFTTVSHWEMDEWEQDDGELYRNDKRTGFRPFLDLPRHTSQRLELALSPDEGDAAECAALRERGWSIVDAYDVARTPWQYQGYIQRSRGEFSCVKPSCIRRQNAWISDRTICYLASGRPAVIQHTGPSRFLPDDAGLFRFRDLPEAIRGLETVARDYERQCRLARALAEEFFDARRVVPRLLERALA